MTTDHKHNLAQNNLASIVLAAGNGTRMKSSLPKVMHPVAGKPMLGHVLTALEPLEPEKVTVVVAPHMDDVKTQISEIYTGIGFATQDKQLGTGHAVRCGCEALGDFDGTILVVYGDTPLIQADTLARLLEVRTKHNAAISMLGMHPDDPTGYGRLVMQKEPFVERIVECKDANEKEKQIDWVWAGMMAFDAKFLKEGLQNIQPSSVTGEYYLTSLIEVARNKDLPVVMTDMVEEEAMGVNNRGQLSQAETIVQNRLRHYFMSEGVTLMSPDTTYFTADTKIGKDVVIQPNVFFGPNVTIGDHVTIKAFSHIEGTVIESGATVGPFARLRPGSTVGENAHVGNFVELKKTTLAKGAKANHLSYIGDATVGEGANIGAGTITCNYDGINKYQTTIGKDAFIGSNSSLVAPVTIGEGAIVGASSVITQNVEDNALALTRPQQINIEGKAIALRQRKQKSA